MTEVLILEKEAATYRDALAAHFPDLVIHATTALSDALSCCTSVSAVVGLAHELPSQLLSVMPKLRWIQALTTGTDSLTAQSGLSRQVIITSGRGIHGPQMSEMAFLYMIALLRDFRRMMTNQANAQWERWPQRLLMGKTAVLLGIGAISEDLARRCQAFGMRVIGISDNRSGADGFDAIYPRAQMTEIAAQTDFFIVLVPYSPATHHMVDARLLAALPPRAILINLARGNVIDEQALIAALKEKRITGAGLDVFATEPLPADNPLWQMDNVIITPRVGGMSDIYAQQIMPLLLENMGHFIAGHTDKLRNIVERT
ncbi:MAG TPA: D-2-hydroxyacid dehydrogenase [Magnetospirillaceae bacterium]|jgi:phosphoglycerate dehydrogenase-like enzyme